MDTIKDFEDILFLLAKHKVRYVIVGGLAFIYHAKPRYTKDIDIWIEPTILNIKRVNKALSEFGSPYLISFPIKKDEILQLGLAPNRIDFLLTMPPLKFKTVWKKRIKGKYGGIIANWIDIDSLIKIKKLIPSLRHQDDAAILLEVKKMIKGKKKYSQA